MRVNYSSVDLHRSEREVIVVNKKKNQNRKCLKECLCVQSGPEYILHLNQLLYSKLKVFHSLP